MPSIRAWGDDLVVVLFEFLDDDTKLAQSCTDWFYVQHWYTVVPDPAMRVTLWALMGAGKDCEVCHTIAPSAPFDGRFHCKHPGKWTKKQRRCGQLCVRSALLTRDPVPSSQSRPFSRYAVHGKTAAAASPGST